MASDLFPGLGVVSVDLLGSTLNASLALLRDLDLILPHLLGDKQLLIPLLKLILGLLNEPNRVLNLLLQFLNVSRVEPQTPILLELDKQVTLLIGELPYHSPNRRLLTDELGKNEGLRNEGLGNKK